MLTINEIRDLPVFDGLPDEDLTWFVERAEVRELQPGEVLFERGAPALYMYVVLDGCIQLHVIRGEQRRFFGTLRRGSVSGILPYSRMTHFNGEVEVVEPARVATLHKDLFPELLRELPELGQRLIGIMADRVREGTRGQQQQEKMLALGKLSAGLAHELNNPASAVRRAADALRERLTRQSRFASRLIEVGLSAGQMRELQGRLDAVLARMPDVALSTLERGACEDEIADWLDDRDVPDSWLLAETFVEAGLTIDDLEAICAFLDRSMLPCALGWMEGFLAVDCLLAEIGSASDRISSLVASVKAYSHMDQAQDKRPTVLKEGLDNTLTMLGHKLKKKGIRVERVYENGSDPVPAFPGELNQVWTNLIDNAIDAMDEGGRLEVRTGRDGTWALVQISDNGSGIPPEIQSRIFDPFFTTKEVGAGTGLGLDIVHRIVTRRHEGRIDVQSHPGHTTFTVRLPTEGS